MKRPVSSFVRGMRTAANATNPSMAFSQPISQTLLSQLRIPKPSFGLANEELAQEEDIPLEAQTTEEAIKELNAMLRGRKKPTISQFNQAISLAADESRAGVGRKIFTAIERAGVRPNAETFTRLLDGVLRGKLEAQEEALFYIGKMQVPVATAKALPKKSLISNLSVRNITCRSSSYQSTRGW